MGFFEHRRRRQRSEWCIPGMAHVRIERMVNESRIHRHGSASTRHPAPKADFWCPPQYQGCLGRIEARLSQAPISRSCVSKGRCPLEHRSPDFRPSCRHSHATPKKEAVKSRCPLQSWMLWGSTNANVNHERHPHRATRPSPHC